MDLKIIFIGTPKFGSIILQGLIKKGFKPILVITEKDKAKGRKQILSPSSVKITAEKYNIPVVHTLEFGIKPDLIITAATKKILIKEVLGIPKYGCINVHPSLLPKYRGPSPIQTAILDGEKNTGVTIYLMDSKIDHGKIISQTECEIKEETCEVLSEKLAEIGADLLIRTIPAWINKEIKAVTQEESEATYTKILKKDDAKISWQKSAIEIERQIRAFYPWPGSFTLWQKNGKLVRVKILKSDVLKTCDNTSPIGKVLLKDSLLVKCGKQCLIIRELQVEGKNPMSYKDFLKGNSQFINTILK